MSKLLLRHGAIVTAPRPAVSERLLRAIRTGLDHGDEAVVSGLSLAALNMAWMAVGLKLAGNWPPAYAAKSAAAILDPIARELHDAACAAGWCLGPANQFWRPEWIVALDQPTFDELNAALDVPRGQGALPSIHLRLGRALGYPEADILVFAKFAGQDPQIAAALAAEPELGRYQTYVPCTESGLTTLREAARRIQAVFGVRPPLQP
jgi:hypothetical protein